MFSDLPVAILAWVLASTSGLMRKETRATFPRAAATALGTSLGDAAVVVNAALVEARAALTPEQQAMLNTVVENVSARRDENRYANAERFLELRSDLDLTGAQKAAIAAALREVLRHLPMDIGSSL